LNDKYFFHVKKQRPEETFGSVIDYFDESRCSEYSRSKSMMRIQRRITLRALELLEIPKDNLLILDAGCGPGFASFYLDELNYTLIALDLIPYFLKYYDMRIVNPISADMCLLPFKPNKFDVILSISALQWVFREIHNESMKLNLINLIQSFYYVLKPNSKAIFQFYPKNTAVMDSIGKIITNNSSFKGNYIIDNPENPKKRKIFLILQKERE
jgi:18S rRNA (guanine1575-N7)-methyltransferase